MLVACCWVDIMTFLRRFQVFARWWRQHHPFITQFIHDYGSFLVHYLAPFTPGAARRAGYCYASNDLLRSLDRVDVELPGAAGSWSSRWRSRCPGGRGNDVPGRIGSVYTAVGGAGVAAVVVLLAAAGATNSPHPRSEKNAHHRSRIVYTICGVLRIVAHHVYRGCCSCYSVGRACWC